MEIKLLWVGFVVEDGLGTTVKGLGLKERYVLLLVRPTQPSEFFQA